MLQVAWRESSDGVGPREALACPQAAAGFIRTLFPQHLVFLALIILHGLLEHTQLNCQCSPLNYLFFDFLVTMQYSFLVHTYKKFIILKRIFNVILNIDHLFHYPISLNENSSKSVYVPNWSYL